MQSGKRLHNESRYQDIWELAVRGNRDYFIKDGQCYKLKPGARTVTTIDMYVRGGFTGLTVSVGGAALAAGAPLWATAIGTSVGGTETVLRLAGEDDTPITVTIWMLQNMILDNVRNPCRIFLSPQFSFSAPGVPPVVFNATTMYNKCVASKGDDMPSEHYEKIDPPPPPSPPPYTGGPLPPGSHDYPWHVFADDDCTVYFTHAYSEDEAAELAGDIRGSYQSGEWGTCYSAGKTIPRRPSG